MIVSIKTYEQYCIHLDKNIIIEEKIFNNGRKIIICKNKELCRKCKNSILPDFENINY